MLKPPKCLSQTFIHALPVKTRISNLVTSNEFQIYTGSFRNPMFFLWTVYGEGKIRTLFALWHMTSCWMPEWQGPEHIK